MKFTIFETKFGYSGIVYLLEDNSATVKHVFLPRSKKAVKTAIMDNFAEALSSPGHEVSELRSRIQNFFLGKPDTIPQSLVDLTICAPFQLSVLMEEYAIPRGMTSSYGRIAKRLNSKAVRAVGNALARNPFPIVIPCHRAIRSDRTLGGFQGGLEMKRRILNLEGVKFDSDGRVHIDCFLDTP